MTWMGEAPSGVLVFYTVDGTPGQIPLGVNDQILKIVNNTPVWATPAAGSAFVSETEIDFGATPVLDATFTVTDASITTTHKILAVPSFSAPTGKDRDELEMDDLQIKCLANNGDFTMYIKSADGTYLHDKFKINYTYA